MRLAVSLSVLAATAAAGACTAGESSAGGTSGPERMTVVANDVPAWSEAERWSVHPDPELVIGILDGPEEYQLFDVIAAARQSDGDWVIADGGAHTVRLYDRSGTFVATLGGVGSGPGEFREPSQILIGPDDTIRVWDNAEFRVTSFDAEGTLSGVRVVRLAGIAKAVEPPLYPASARLLPGGDLLVRLVEKTKDMPAEGRFRRGSGVLRVSVDMSEIDTLTFFADVEQAAVSSVFGLIAVAAPLAKTTEIATHGKEDRSCIGEQERPEVTCFGPGDARTLFRWTDEPVRPGRDEITAWRDAAIETYVQKMTRDDARRLVDQVPLPDTRPPYASLVLDHSDYLWVERGPSEGEESESVDYLVFDPEGALLGVVGLPPLDVLEIGEDYVAGVYRDEFEVQYLHVYGIKKPDGTRPAP